MKISEIFELWDKDCKIDVVQLHLESLKISELHNKYYKIYISEKLVLKNLKSKFTELKHNKYEFYTMGPTEETKSLGWELPPKGRIFKNEVEPYLSVDPQLVELALKIGTQEEKIELLKSILETVGKRSFQIRAAVDFIKFQNGQ